MIVFASATRLTKDAFWEKSALGRSLLRLDPAEHARFVARVAFDNRRGLSAVFNEVITSAGRDDIVVFLHDDVWIDDLFICDHLEQALREFAVVGVAGNSRRTPLQPGWPFVVERSEIMLENLAYLRGGIAHGAQPCGEISRYGAAPAECELLDGVFLAVRGATLAQSGLVFDPRFEFHFYDVDFCRSARAKGLRVGCWPIALTHQSQGGAGYTSPAWQAAYTAYLNKWKD